MKSVQLRKSSAALMCVVGTTTCDPGNHPVGYWCNSACDSSCAGSAPTAVQCDPNTGLTFQSCDSNCSAYGYSNGPVDTNAICDITGAGSPDALIYTCAINLISFGVLPTNVSAPGQVSGTVGLSNPAPSSNAQVDLSVSPADGVIGLPGAASTLINSGSQTLSFQIAVNSLPSVDTTYVVTAKLHDNPSSFRTASLTVHAPPAVASVAFTSTTVVGGQPLTGTVTLAAAAPSGSLAVTVTSTNAVSITSPFTILVPAGATTQTFSIPTQSVGATTTADLTFATVAGGPPPTTVTLTPAPPTSPVVADANCAQFSLAANDDESTDAVPLNLPLNFFGTTYDFVYVNNNGNVTFSAPLGAYTPFTIGANTPPIIAPFLADVDTRPAGSALVTYGHTTFGGRQAFCVNWSDVGYFLEHTDKLNKFQLLLVERGDIGSGDFDIIMNYERILWETGDASGGVNGFGGTSAGAGFSAGNGDPNDFFQFPGSMQNGAFLDSNGTSGLANTNRNTLQRGRHIFAVRNGVPPTGGGLVTGQITSAANGAPLANAPVQVCPAAGGQCVYVTRTGTDGRYVASGIQPGSYRVSAFPPVGSTAIAATSAPVTMPVNPTSPVQVDLALANAAGIPPGTTISPATIGAGGVPSVYWQNTLDLRTTGCAQGTASYNVVGANGATFASGGMVENPLGFYSAQIPPFYPSHGAATITITLVCKDGSVHTNAFNIYIDPSGFVRTVHGVPVPDAKVTLFRSDTGLEFDQVEFGSDIMSPSNRINPDLTREDGHFGWDVIAGFYKVRAEHAGCTAPGTGAAYVESPVLSIPPAVLDLDLRLDCPALEDTTAPVSVATLIPAPNGSGWNHGNTIVNITATDDKSGVKEIVYSLSGAQTGGATVAGAAAQADVTAEGITTVTFFARDNAGNQEAAHTVVVRIDRTRPALSCSATPSVLFPPNHKLLPVHVTVQLSDSLSGPATFVLSSVTSNEPDDGDEDGDTTGDIQGWSVGTADTDGLLRAERSGAGTGRVYTLVYTARDQAGNSSTCSTTVTVPVHP